MRCSVNHALMLLVGLSASSHVLADWQDWWQTPEQQAAEAFEQGDHERLLQQAPDAGWAGLGHYQAGDFDAAANAFAERAGQLQQQGEEKAANRALYNQGVSNARAGRYDDAIEQFEAVLDSDPSFVDAAHNRDIARQLQELQRQQEQQSRQGDEGESGEGEPGDENEQGQQGESGDQSSSGDQEQPGDSASSADSGDQSGQNSSAESPSAEQSDTESGQSSEQAQESSGEQESDQDRDQAAAETEAERQTAAEAAQRALEAEARQAGEDPAGEGVDSGSATEPGTVMEEENDRPLSESEQATEQLLRRIPDDPAGLLRRRLEQSHRNKYPEVRGGRDAW